MDAVKKYKIRREGRMNAKAGREDDQWITMKGTHVLIDDGGQVSKGPDKLKNVVQSSGGYKPGTKSSNSRRGAGIENRATERNRRSGRGETNSNRLGGFGYMDYLDRSGFGKTGSKPEADSPKKYADIPGRKLEESENKTYTYGPGDERRSMKDLKKEPEKESTDVGKTYESLPISVRIFGRKNASPDDVKKVRETVTEFMKNAKEGDIYTVGGGVGSAGGQRFKVTTSRGKPALAWERDGYFTRPVQMSRANVEDFISNGAKLVERKQR